jgi:hypothetical protein
MSKFEKADFLKQAQGKSAEDRTFFEKIAVGLYGEEKEILPDLQLDDNFEDLITQLPLDVQEDVLRYKNIFRATPEVVETFLEEYRDKGFSDYIEKSRFYDDGIKLADQDQARFQDYNFLGKGAYDAAYRKDKAGDKARQIIKESIPGQLAVGVTTGLGTAVN